MAISTTSKRWPGPALVVIGGSAGGIESLQRLIPGIPVDFAGAIAIVLHRMPFEEDQRLAHVLGRKARLPVRHAVDGERVEAGTIVLCPANVHVRVHDGRFVLDAGPRENNVRPAIDVLFRTAAEVCGESVAGVLLSGLLDDGSAGMAAIRARGGSTIVQDPDEALFADMPRNAMHDGVVDIVASVAEIPDLLVEFVNRVRSAQTGASFPELSAPSEFACPDCHGVLWRVESEGGDRYRCRTGHAYSPHALLERQQDTLEEALWAAIRALEEHSDASDALARRFLSQGLGGRARRLERAATDAKRRARLVRSALPSVEEAERDADVDSEDRHFVPVVANGDVTIAWRK
jgi:two-component system, chemotaxis family, protein-glutamate methylesterase/glutaminase